MKDLNDIYTLISTLARIKKKYGSLTIVCFDKNFSKDGFMVTAGDISVTVEYPWEDENKEEVKADANW